MLGLRAMHVLPLAAVWLVAGYPILTPSMAGSRSSPPAPPCSTVVSAEREGTPGLMQPSGDENHQAWRLKNWRTPVTKQGKWVGVVARDSNDSDSRAKYFPGLSPGRSGCVYFADTATVTTPQRRAVAELRDARDSLLHAYNGAIICDGGHPHTPPPIPVEADPAEQCLRGTRGALLIPPPDSSGRGTILRFEVGANGFEGTIRDSLNSKRALVPPAVMAAFFSKGPWFPCSETGCCRPI